MDQQKLRRLTEAHKELAKALTGLSEAIHERDRATANLERAEEYVEARKIALAEAENET
jgi:hypothetical protein